MARGNFEQLANRYDAWYATPIGAWADRHEVAVIFRLLAVQPGERLLDLGTGTGRYALVAAQQRARVVGVDTSPAMLEFARTRSAGQSVHLVRANAMRLPFADASFDVALAVTSLCFVADPLTLLHEVRRVVKPGGRLVIGELNRWSLWALVRRVEGLVRPTTYLPAHFRSIRELHRLLVASGFIPVRWEGVLHVPPLNRTGWLAALEPIERCAQRRTRTLGAFLAIEARRSCTLCGSEPVLPRDADRHSTTMMVWTGQQERLS